ncbi:hypothetical protein HU200_051322 [Digitaria exilis]|uniref:SBP-type domain-containing protein n=1 Tax=Digitaria exilis TaxID=1010633 RepID=A0A835E562_9POAL|nr:hypothetical protein HU200_051322 [Digitaria exilis]
MFILPSIHRPPIVAFGRYATVILPGKKTPANRSPYSTASDVCRASLGSLPLTYARLGRPPLRPHSAAAAGLLHWPRWLATAEETRRKCPVWLDAQPERNFMLTEQFEIAVGLDRSRHRFLWSSARRRKEAVTRTSRPHRTVELPEWTKPRGLVSLQESCIEFFSSRGAAHADLPRDEVPSPGHCPSPYVPLVVASPPGCSAGHPRPLHHGACPPGLTKSPAGQQHICCKPARYNGGGPARAPGPGRAARVSLHWVVGLTVRYDGAARTEPSQSPASRTRRRSRILAPSHSAMNATQPGGHEWSQRSPVVSRPAGLARDAGATHSNLSKSSPRDTIDRWRLAGIYYHTAGEPLVRGILTRWRIGGRGRSDDDDPLAKQATKRRSRAPPPPPPRQLSGSSSIASSLAGAAMDRKGHSASAAVPMDMAALAAAAAAGQSSSGQATDGSLPPHANGEEENTPATLAAVGCVASTASSPVVARRGAAAGGGPSCQVERCAADLQEAKRYHRRHKVCEPHSKALVVLVAGLRQRFSGNLSQHRFDDVKHSCRRRLAGHNERRRKSSVDRHGSGGDQDDRSHPGNPPSVVCLLRLSSEDVRVDWLDSPPLKALWPMGIGLGPASCCRLRTPPNVEKKGGGSRTAHSAEVGTDEATGLHSTAAGESEKGEAADRTWGIGPARTAADSKPCPHAGLRGRRLPVVMIVGPPLPPCPSQ